MLSPHTPPGTRVICINTRDTFYIDPSEARRRTGNLDGLTEGQVYIVRAWEHCPEIIGGFSVSVNEIRRGRTFRVIGGDEQGFAPQRFKVLETQETRKATQRPVAEPVRARELEMA